MSALNASKENKENILTERKKQNESNHHINFFEMKTP
jgi:hypothetical protein